MSIYSPLIQGIYTPRPSSVYAATQSIIGKDLIDPKNADGRFSTNINPEVSGIIAYLNVTAVPGVDTVQLALEEIDPVSGVVTTLAATTATAVTGLVRLELKQAIAAIAATTTQVQVQDTLPPQWRIRVIHSAASNFTYSLGIVLYN